MATGDALDRLIDRLTAAAWPEDADVAALRQARDRAVPWLVDRLAREPRALRRRRLCDALADLVADTPALLAPYLQAPSWYLARNLAYVLGELRRPEGVPHLAALARHEEPRVRREVVDALRKIGGSAAREALVAFLDDPDGRIRRHAIDALDAVYDGRAAARLVALLRSADFSPEGVALKEAAAAALARMGAPEAKPVLEAVARGWTLGRARRRVQHAARGVLTETYSSR
ncbi:MAG TPA: HEAT repeat domain-containing protein [bacterium]|nr:HEAT repeat domain-containing protein [bacterium]